MSPAMLRALVVLHDAVAARVHASPALRVIIGREVLVALAAVAQTAKENPR